MWFKNTVHTIDPGKGPPIRLSVRTDTHIAALFKTLEAYIPSPNGDHSKDTYAVSLFLVPLDGSDPRCTFCERVRSGEDPWERPPDTLVRCDGKGVMLDF